MLSTVKHFVKSDLFISHVSRSGWLSRALPELRVLGTGMQIMLLACCRMSNVEDLKRKIQEGNGAAEVP